MPANPNTPEPLRTAQAARILLEEVTRNNLPAEVLPSKGAS